MKHLSETFDVVVCGGGLAGFCAAVAAARHGARTCLVHNRPVLGGNSSSEVGVTPHGTAAFHAYARETGIISEALIEERALNHAEIYENGWTNSVWDMVLYDIAMRTPGLTLHLNTDVKGVVMDDSVPATEPEVSAGLGYFHRPSSYRGKRGRVLAVLAETQNAEVELRLEGRLFIDCTGDALIADRAGCEWRMGSESREEFGEVHAPAEASADTMGNSIHFLCRDMGRPVPYHAPEWAVHHEDGSFFYDQGRLPKDERGGFWWLEIGVPHHTIHDNETIRHELTRHALGVWDWMKNRDPKMKERCANYALDWIGQVPGKRESRRIIGLHLMTEIDVQEKVVFEDEVAFGGWFVDLHTPGGLLAESSEPTSADGTYDTFNEYAVKSYCGPYGIPLRSLIAKDVDNLMMAGRNVSATHAALGTVRVMGTTALMGQACGTAAAHAIQHGLGIEDTTSGEAIRTIQQQLLRDGCFLPNIPRADVRDLVPSATIEASSVHAIRGAGPETTAHHEGLAIWKDQPQYKLETLETRRGQLLSIGPEGIETLSLCLSNSSDQAQTLQAKLYALDHIWDYRIASLEPLGETVLEVPAGVDQAWIAWENLNLPGVSPDEVGRFLRIDVLPNDALTWHSSPAIVPGHTGFYQIGEDQMRRFASGLTLSFQTEPAQSVFAPEFIQREAARPHRRTNLWCCDPGDEAPSLTLRWDDPQEIDTIELTFPGHLVREYHAYAPFYRDAQTSADYRVLAKDASGNWESVVEVRDNYQTRVVHKLAKPISTRELRIELLRTHGDPVKSLYEVRCYGPE